MKFTQMHMHDVHEQIYEILQKDCQTSYMYDLEDQTDHFIDL